MYERLIGVSLSISVNFQLNGGARVASWPRPDFSNVSMLRYMGVFSGLNDALSIVNKHGV